MPSPIKLIPPADLLSQVGGIEQGLQRGRRLRWLGALLAAAQALIVVANSEWFGALVDLDWDRIRDQAWMLIPLFGALLAFFVAASARVWLKESREPFRYTFSVAPFEPMAGASTEPKLDFLSADLLELISKRIRRLSRHDQAADPGVPDEGAASQQADALSHIHIEGSYAKRMRPPRTDPVLEVTAWIRIGPPSAPMNLAHPVKFRVRDGKLPGPRREITDDAYEDIVERVYFSVATEIYRRIQDDVRHKISLLPRRYFRGIAYFHEAEDYGRSNTLDAYDQARALYADSLATYDPTWGAAWSPKGRPRPFLWLRKRRTMAFQRLRRAATYVWPRVGRIEVLIAKTLLGYSNSLLYRRILASQLGMSQNPIFEAKPLAERAQRRLEQMTQRVHDRDATLFEAFTTLAFAFNQMGSDLDAEQRLADARGVDPRRADTDPRYTFVAGLLEPDILAAIRTLRRTVELDPSFEAAQFELAKRHQMLWERQGTLEENVAKTVAGEYEKVLALNPGNLAAWAARAHMSWLLGDLESARDEYESGRQYKEIVQEAFVVPIDWGLARVTAEQGDFDAAYRHYIDAASGLIAQGRSYDEFRYTAAQIDPISDVVRERFEKYLREVRRRFRHMERDGRISVRVARSVRAFAYNDYGWALQQNYHRTGREQTLVEAKRAYRRAMKLNERYVLPYYNLYWATRGIAEEETREAERWLDKVHEREPSWPEANMLMLARWAQRERRAQREAFEHRRKAAELRQVEKDQARQTKTAYHEPERVIGPDNPLEVIERNLLARPEEARRPVRETKEHAQRADEAHKQAEELEREAARLDERSAHARRQADEVAPRLLPQDWLWDDGEFNWSVFTGWRKKRGCKSNLVWERSFDDFHARALFHWGRAQRRGDDGSRREAVRAVFDTITRSFWPNDFDLLREKRELVEDKKPLDEQIVSIVERWISSDSGTFWTLQWLTIRPFLESERGARVATNELRRIADAKAGELSPGLYRFLADQLKQFVKEDDREFREAVRGVYERACDAAVQEREYALVLYVGDQIADMTSDLAAGDSCYRMVHAADEPELLKEVADRYVDEKRPRPAYDKAAEVLQKAVEFKPAPEYRRTLAFSWWALGEREKALKELTEIDPEAHFGGHWRTEIVQADRFETADASARMQLREWLIPRQHAAVRSNARDDAIDAACALLKATRTRPTPEWEKGEPPLPQPLELAVDVRAFEGGGGSSLEEARTRLIPAMLKRIREERGLAPAGCAVAAVEGEEAGYYRVSVNEVPLEAARVPDGDRDPGGFVIRRLEELLTLHLARFADSEMVTALVEAWVAEDPDARDERAAVRDRVLPDPDARRRLVQVIRELVREQVPVTAPRLEAILRAEREGSLFECVERARHAIRDHLPGRDRDIVPLPDDVTDALLEAWGENDGRTLALSEAVDLAVRDFLARELSRDGRPAAKIAFCVEPPALRPYAARVVWRHFPGVPVLSSDELPPERHDEPESLTQRLVQVIRR